jgi:hypothetical protein
MGTKKFKGLIKNVALGVFVIIMAFPFTANAKKVKFLNSSVVPAATGYVKLTKDNNKNAVIRIQVYDLAEVERLQSSKITYVVWMETDQGNLVNLGRLKSSTGFLSRRHKAILETVSSYKPVKILITSENDMNVQYPGNQVVLKTDRF